MSKLFNKKNFETLIETIDNYGPEWIDSNLDILDDQWHSGLTHKDPEILRSFWYSVLEESRPYGLP